MLCPVANIKYNVMVLIQLRPAALKTACVVLIEIIVYAYCEQTCTARALHLVIYRSLTLAKGSVINEQKISIFKPHENLLKPLCS
jgi:hypothetical protein